MFTLNTLVSLDRQTDRQDSFAYFATSYKFNIRSYAFILMRGIFNCDYFYGRIVFAGGFL